MKTTLDLPAQLMDEIIVLAKREQRDVDDVVASLIQVGLESRGHTMASQKENIDRVASLRHWFAIADQQNANAPDGPSAREILQQDRDRLERN